MKTYKILATTLDGKNIEIESARIIHVDVAPSKDSTATYTLELGQKLNTEEVSKHHELCTNKKV